MSLLRRAIGMRRAAMGRMMRRVSTARAKAPKAGVERPTTMSSIAGRATLFVTGIAASVALIDPAVLHVARNANPGLISLLDAITGLGRSWWVLWPAAVAIAALAVLFRQEQSRKLSAVYHYTIGVLALIFASVAATGLIVNALKLAIGRARPKLFEAVGAVEFSPFSGSSDFASFPSGHAANIFALAVALGFLLPRVRYILLALAAVVAVSRFMTAKHYLTDVIAGAAIGWLVAVAIQRWFELRGILFARRADGARRIKGGQLIAWGWSKLGAKAFG
ncbi:MAG: phosphatase PAP2 family protein [Chitinophagales bacterium]|nr:phosphatase PAP2 family protein [Hyphomicrobiales bacterium]